MDEEERDEDREHRWRGLLGARGNGCREEGWESWRI